MSAHLTTPKSPYPTTCTRQPPLLHRPLSHLQSIMCIFGHTGGRAPFRSPSGTANLQPHDTYLFHRPTTRASTCGQLQRAQGVAAYRLSSHSSPPPNSPLPTAAIFIIFTSACPQLLPCVQPQSPVLNKTDNNLAATTLSLEYPSPFACPKCTPTTEAYLAIQCAHLPPTLASLCIAYGTVRGRSVPAIPYRALQSTPNGTRLVPSVRQSNQLPTANQSGVS